jgi:hypothetical protein
MAALARRPGERSPRPADAERAGQGTALSWTLMCDEPVPDASLIEHSRQRVNARINADLRSSPGQ